MNQRVDFGPFSFDVPERWTLSSVILSGPVEDVSGASPGLPPFQRNLITTMEVVPPDETAESFVKKQVDALVAAQVARQEAAPPEVVTLGEEGHQTGLITEQVITGAQGERVRQMQLVFIKHGVAYAAIASHLDGEPFEQSRSEFRTLLLSYR